MRRGASKDSKRICRTSGAHGRVNKTPGFRPGLQSFAAPRLRREDMSTAVIVSAVRTAVGKAPKGALAGTRPDDLAALTMRTATERVPGLRAEEVDDIYIG